MAEGFSDGVMPFARGHDEQESTAACAEQFSALSAGLAGGFIPCIDASVTDSKAEGAFQLPAVVKKSAKFFQIAAAGEGLAHGVGQIAHLPQHGHLVAGLGALLFEDHV